MSEAPESGENRGATPTRFDMLVGMANNRIAAEGDKPPTNRGRETIVDTLRRSASLTAPLPRREHGAPATYAARDSRDQVNLVRLAHQTHGMTRTH